MVQNSTLRIPITVSVVIATYNRAHYLPQALESLYCQTRPADEIIVIDDGSTDNTAEAIKQYQDKLRYYKLNNNSGKSFAINYGIPLATSSHIWIFDDDDVALPDALQNHVAMLAGHPEIDISYSPYFLYMGNGDIWERTQWRLNKIPMCSAEEFFIRHALATHTLLQGMLIPKYCFEQAGGFDPSLLRSEDDDLTLRFAHRFRMANIQKPTFVLRVHSGPRGPKNMSHGVNQRDTIHLRYSQQIYRRMRDQYPLSAFLPRAPGAPPPSVTDNNQAYALLQRACIMLRRGLIEESLADFKMGLSKLELAKSRMPQIKSMLSTGFAMDLSVLTRPYHLAFALRKQLKIAHATVLTYAIIKGLYWTLRRELRRRRWHDVLRCIIVSVILISPLSSSKHLDFMTNR